MEEFCRLAQIPLEPSTRTNGLNDNTRPPWIRPVPKKTHTSRSRSTHSGDSISQHSSPRFSAFDLFVDMNNDGSPRPTYSPPSSMASSHPPQNGSPVIQGPPLLRHPYSHRHVSDPGPVPTRSTTGGDTARGSPFIDGSAGLGSMDMIRPADPQLYLSPDEVIALFSDGSGVDVNSLFTPEFSQSQVGRNGNAVTGVGPEGVFNPPTFHKIEGLITSP